MFMSPLSSLSALLDCVLTLFGSIMLLACGHEEKCNGTCVWCLSSAVVVVQRVTKSGLALHTTMVLFMTSFPCLGDQNAIKQQATFNRK